LSAHKSFLSLLQSIIDGLLLKADLDIPGGELLEGSLDSLGSLLEEVLLVLVKHDLSHLGAIKSNSDSVADDASRQQKLFQNGFLNAGESSAERSLLGSVLLDPSRLDVSSGHNQDSGLELLLQLRHDLLVQVGEENLVTLIGQVNKGDGFLLTVGDLHNFVNLNE
jgi:hypothetical protein